MKKYPNLNAIVERRDKFEMQADINDLKLKNNALLRHIDQLEKGMANIKKKRDDLEKKFEDFKKLNKVRKESNHLLKREVRRLTQDLQTMRRLIKTNFGEDFLKRIEFYFNR